MLARLHDLAGQSDAAERLSAALATDRLHHALLFAGPDGVGKFTAAMTVAQLAFCADPKARTQATACAFCKSCNKFLAAGHADVVVPPLNDKGHLTVEAIREAIEILHIRPIEGPFKILIIRDAEKMNLSAQNAFLKTLEEPPGGAKIILTTARPDALISTVISRCQRIVFRAVPAADIQSLLVQRQQLEPKAAALVAALAQGSPAKAFATDPAVLIADRDWVADVDQRVDPTAPRAVPAAIASAAEMADAKDSLRNRLDLLRVWLRDQILVASGARVEIANVDRREDVEALARRRGLTTVLSRARALEHARQQLDLPYNLKAALIVEQLFIAFAGLGGRV